MFCSRSRLEADADAGSIQGQKLHTAYLETDECQSCVPKDLVHFAGNGDWWMCDA